MFESDNFDFDEEFLKDVDWKETEYCSQGRQNQEENIAKKPKYDIQSTKSTNFPQARKDLLLGILEGPQNCKKSFQKKAHAVQPLSTKQLKNFSEENPAKEKISSRKTLILDIFKKGPSTAKKLLHNKSDSLQLTPNDGEKQTKTISSIGKNVELKSPIEKLSLVRKFPGPAGLIPDSADEVVLPVSYLNSMDENENENEHEKSKTSDFCSQNTKILFSEGAWKLMMDDIPRDYLEGHNISLIKQKARAKCFTNGKIPILAAVIQHIDYSSENPRVVLKDFTDAIEGVIHQSILSKYPNILRAGVVLLLNDVGFLMTGTWNTCLVMISLRCIVNIFSNIDKIEISTNSPNSKTMKSNESEELFDQNPYETSNLDIEGSKIFTWDEDEKIEETTKESDILCKQTIVNTSAPQQKPISIRSKLLEFRSKDAITPPATKESERTSSSALSEENKSPNESSKSPHEDWATNLMNDSENDSDDELLSQLDVDSIVSNFNDLNHLASLSRN
ncbi:uncharacterized protein LOC107269254 [Cephus cinctus]|uniref:Uncharacterized protein LOC107269254 n=1 Tax=Cephus cinctus TaxID=211228 RepID=A0AAJ7BZP5_CEPCN|nr:uncharacterized protein LOC107269254 [Cephus cinctus]